MNKLSLKGLPSGRTGLGNHGIQVEKAIVIVDKAPDIDSVRDFFDLVIVCSADCLEKCPEPDVFVHCSANLDRDGTLSLPDVLAGLQKSLIVVHKDAVKKMRARNLRPTNYMIETSESSALEACQDFLHKIGTGNEKIWTVSGPDLASLAGARINQQEFFNARDKYLVQTNRKFAGRKILMEK